MKNMATEILKYVDVKRFQYEKKVTTIMTIKNKNSSKRQKPLIGVLPLRHVTLYQ